MGTTVKMVVGLVVLAAAWAWSAGAQSAGVNPSSSRALPSSMAPAQPQQPKSEEVVREIDDPHTGDRWLLIRGPSRSGGPGRMVLATLGLSAIRQRGPEGARPQEILAAQRTPILPVIHTGDRLIVEENTTVAEARLEAIAMGPALTGSPLNVRLSIGGNVVRAVALGPGRAAFAPEVGPRP